jgi:predicted dithiol-disulfide oxidoreductase (DUF899 family)
MRASIVPVSGSSSSSGKVGWDQLQVISSSGNAFNEDFAVSFEKDSPSDTRHYNFGCVMKWEEIAMYALL